jgi:BON domain
MRTPGKLLSAILAGAGAMYLLDPDRGGRRRALLRDRGVHAWHKAEGRVESVARDIRNRSAGAVSGIRSRFRRNHADDEVIEERARSALGRALSRPGAIDVVAYEGRVVLTGPVLAREHGQAISAVKRVRGVRDVEDQLEPHGSADAVRALQGGAQPGKRRSAPRRESWSRATRLLAAVAGGMALARGLVTGVRAGRSAVKSVPQKGKTSTKIRAPW